MSPFRLDPSGRHEPALEIILSAMKRRPSRSLPSEAVCHSGRPTRRDPRQDQCWHAASQSPACSWELRLACFWQLAIHPFDLLVGVQQRGLNDLSECQLGNRDYPRVTLHGFGQMPYWNPYLGCGAPHLGNAQSAFLYPPSWLFWIFGARSLISWVLVGHHLLGGFGTYGLSRHYGCSRLGATFAGVAFLASPVLLANSGAGHLGALCEIAWVPWAFWAYERFRLRLRWGFPGLAVVLALTLIAGHPQESVLLVLSLTCLWLYDCVRLLFQHRPGQAFWLLVCWPAIGLVAAALVMGELIPMGIQLWHSILRPAAEPGRLGASRRQPGQPCPAPPSLLPGRARNLSRSGILLLGIPLPLRDCRADPRRDGTGGRGCPAPPRSPLGARWCCRSDLRARPSRASSIRYSSGRSRSSGT